ncbi:MAG: flagellar biosynthetic protein FliO [Acidocella sp.]|nr:flagellar biosynthetic protein FliO [Acidocella sp.]
MSGIGGGQAVSTVVSMVVIFAVLGIAMVLSRRLRFAVPWRKTTSCITVLGARSLGGQNTLVMIQAEDQRFLIGVSRTTISVIGRLDGGDRHE